METSPDFSPSHALLSFLEFSWNEKEYRVDIDAEPGVTYTTTFYGTLKNADVTSKPALDADGKKISHVTRKYSDELGKVLLETKDDPAVYPFTSNELYVRAKITSSKLNPDPFAEGDLEMAWTQPALR